MNRCSLCKGADESCGHIWLWRSLAFEFMVHDVWVIVNQLDYGRQCRGWDLSVDGY